MIKSDIRYIVKKVIIGILITLGVLFLKPLLASAEEIENYYINYYDYLFNNSSYSLFMSSSQVTNSSVVDSFVLYDKYKINLTMKKDFNYNGYYYLLYNKTTNQYAMQYFASEKELNFNYTYSLSYKQSLSTENYTLSKGNFYVYYNSDFNNIQNSLDRTKYTYETDYKNLGTSTLGATLYKISLFDISDNNLKMTTSDSIVINENDWEIVSTNIKSNIYKVKNDIVFKFYEYKTISNNYEKLDMFNKYAVLFYPKDFRNIPSECTKSSNVVTTDDDGNVTIIPNGKCDEISYKFNFYYAGYFNTAFANLKDMSIVSDPVEQLPFPSTSTPYELPLYKNVDDFKGGILFYNDYKSQITDDDGIVTVYYDKGFIWYDFTLYNYIVVDDPSSKINQDITYIDENGENQTTNINNIPTKNKTSINPAEDTYDFFKNFKTNDHGLSSIITSPLQAIKNLTSSTCNSLNLPIPFSKGQTISLPCMTSIYENKFGIIYTMYKTIVTGYIGYWICVRIYTLIKGFKDPDDDKVEVLDL